MKPKTPAPKPAKAAPGLPKNAPGEVRIIGGQWKRSKLSVLSRPGLRPTPDRVRETVFNWLGQDLTGLKCIDAFAGSGALGFEAASRGAQDVLLIEQDQQLIATLQSNQTRLKATTIRISEVTASPSCAAFPKPAWM
jgi:16S rRNA (guanine966-N2)-methyltransferase